MLNYLFEIISDNEFYGENFFVQEKSLAKSWAIVDRYFPNETCRYIDSFNDEEAEMMGYDTY